MRMITIHDMQRRINGLRELESESTLSNTTFIESANALSKSGRSQDIVRLIESMAKSSSDIPFRYYMKLYDALLEQGSMSISKKMAGFVNNEVMPKVRDAMQTLHLIHRRLGKTKSKAGNTSYIHKSQENLQTSITSPLTSTGQLYTPPGSTVHVSHQADEVANEAYQAMYDSLFIYSHCDRVLENYDRISKRFNLEMLFNENTRQNDVYDTVVELCGFIDTYNMPTDIKFNTVIETAWYGFESNTIDYERKDILEAAVEYFAFKENGISACREIIETTLFFDKDEDTKNIDILMEEEPEEDTKPSISESVMNYCIHITETMNTKTDEVDFDKIFADFKKKELNDDATKNNKLKNLVTRLYSKNVSNIVGETPKFFRWIRSFFIIGSATVPVIGPVLMAVSYIADRCITLSLERKEVEQMVICFNKEIESSKAKLASTKDEQTRERLEKYIETLTEASYKIKNYYNDLFDGNEDHPDPDDLGTEKQDDEWFVNEALINKIANMLEKEYEHIGVKNNVLNEDTIYRLIRFGKIANDDIVNIATAAAKFPSAFYKDTVTKAIRDSIEDIDNGTKEFDTTIDKYIAVDNLNTSFNILKNTDPVPETENLNEAILNAECILEANSAICTLINNMEDNRGSMLEASFLNTLRMASMKLKNAMTKANDRERSMSKNLDAAVNNLTKGVERALTNDNREAVVKGTFLPSASKVIKICLSIAAIGGSIGLATGTAVYGIAAAVISLIGYIGCSAKFKAKERQMVIDEIEIELKICKKYIEIAESKNDMKALRELLSIQRNLERQLQRIKYKMKVNFGQKYYDSKAD